ncbi:MAG: hypothetical protein IJ608_04160 [Lachnospiraceae bacterium]|nr:hypothetical protein [Lachnospiraceae bacterium]
MAESVLEKLIKMEDEYSLFDLKCGDFRPWGYLRWRIFGDMEIKFGEVSGTRFGSSIFEKLKKMADAYRVSIGKTKPKESKVLFISHPRRFFSDGKYKCIYTDVLADMYGDDACVIENGYVHMTPAYSRYLYYPDSDVISGTMRDALYSKAGDMLVNSSDKVILKTAAESIENAIENTFDTRYPKNEIYKKLIFNYLTYGHNVKRAQKLLNVVKPKLIVEVVGYTAPNMALNEVAKKRGIPTVELQHGVIGSGHFGYNYGKKRQLSFMPDYMCLWGDYWKETAFFMQENERLLSCGYPYLEEKVSKCERKSEEFMAIVVLSQPIVADVIAKSIIEFADILDKEGAKYRIYYKLHPSEYEVEYEFFAKLERSGVEIIKDSAVTVYELFARADIQIGAFSTAIFEGMNFGLDTYIIDTPKAEAYVGDLYKNGYAALIKSGKELYEACKKRGDGTKKSFDGSHFFKRNAKANIKSELDGIMKKEV